MVATEPAPGDRRRWDAVSVLVAAGFILVAVLAYPRHRADAWVLRSGSTSGELTEPSSSIDEGAPWTRGHARLRAVLGRERRARHELEVTLGVLDALAPALRAGLTPVAALGCCPRGCGCDRRRGGQVPASGSGPVHHGRGSGRSRAPRPPAPRPDPRWPPPAAAPAGPHRRCSHGPPATGWLAARARRAAAPPPSHRRARRGPPGPPVARRHRAGCAPGGGRGCQPRAEGAFGLTFLITPPPLLPGVKGSWSSRASG